MIYLVRHGRAEAGAEALDPGLDELGHEQARAAAAALAGTGAGRLVVSPLRRTQETATPIAAALGLEPELREEVAEVFAPEMPVPERRAFIGPFMAGTWADYPDFHWWRRRVVATLLEMGRAAAGARRDLVIVSHYIAIGVAIGEALGSDLVVPVLMANAAITSIEVRAGRLQLIEACSTAHLREDQVTGTHSALLGNAARR